MKSRAIICDIDGTLADCSRRQRHLMDPDKKKDWDAFYSEMHEGPVNPWCRELIRAMQVSGLAVFMVTGRPERYRSETMHWLITNKVYHNGLLMRKDGDFRDDTIVKEEILNNLQMSGIEILFAIDDRKRVVDMWRKNGITCLQCAEGNF